MIEWRAVPYSVPPAWLGQKVAAECFATLAEDAVREGWSHVDYLARVVAE